MSQQMPDNWHPEWGPRPAETITEPIPARRRKMSRRAKWGCGAAILAVLGLIGSLADSPPPAPEPVAAVAAEATTATDPTTEATTPEATTAKAKPVSKPAPVTYQHLSSRQWKQIARDPDAHAGETIIVYGQVTQADAATGSDVVLADVGGVKLRGDYGFYDYPTNTILSEGAGDVSGLVEDDLFEARVTVVGSFDYDTQIGGGTTAPHLMVERLKRTGSAS